MKKIFYAVLLLALAWGITPRTWAASLEDPELERQEILAREYQFQIARTPVSETSAKEKLYLRLITECPATEAAEEAYWNLANFYLDDMEEPQEEKAREVLERFLERYPSSQWSPHVKNRLAWFKWEKK